MAEYVDVHFLKLYEIYMVSLCKKIESLWNQSIKPIRITENISVWKKCSGQALFKRPNLRPGQLSKPGQKFVWGQFWDQNWAQATRPMGPSQFRSRFIVCQRRAPLYRNVHVRGRAFIVFTAKSYGQTNRSFLSEDNHTAGSELQIEFSRGRG